MYITFSKTTAISNLKLTVFIYLFIKHELHNTLRALHIVFLKINVTLHRTKLFKIHNNSDTVHTHTYMHYNAYRLLIYTYNLHFPENVRCHINLICALWFTWK